MRTLFVAVALVGAVLQTAGHAQQAPAQTAQPIFRSGTRLVVQTVSVKDKDGRPIEGLTAKEYLRFDT